MAAAAENSKNTESDELNKLNKKIDELTNEFNSLVNKSNARGEALNKADHRRIEKLEDKIKDSKLNRQSLLKKVFKHEEKKPAPTVNKKPKPALKKAVPPPSIDDPWDEAKEGSFIQVQEKQIQLKTYYDSFPEIGDTISKAGRDLKEANDLTESILNTLPSGDVTERTTACHVINSVFESRNMKCLFFDSSHGKNLHDASNTLAEIDSEDRPLVLKLYNSEGLGSMEKPKTEHGEIRFVQTITEAIEQNQTHPVIEDVLNRLARAHGIDKKDIQIKTVYVGSFGIVYTVKDLAKRTVQSVTNVAQKLKSQFDQFLTAKIHPLLFRPSFDISFFDKQGNKTFPDAPGTHQIGPYKREQTYIPPADWTRYGLKVLGKYQDGNRWLEPFGDQQNWYRAYHGTGSAIAADFGDPNKSIDQRFAAVDATASIFQNEFRVARVAAYGAGVYCSPNPTFPEHGYTTPVELDTQQGKKKFKCMLQVAVNPNGVNFTKNKDIWVVPDPKDIRPYGILIKEVN